MPVVHKPGITYFQREGAKRVTAEEVRGWFDDAAKGKAGRKRAPIPDTEECAKLADRLNIKIDLGDTPPIRWTESAANVKKYGRLFLQHLAVETKKHEARFADGRKRDDGDLQVSEAMRLAEEHVEKLLEFYDYPLMNFSWHDDARHIEELAKEAWQATGRAPQSRNPDDPLCIFVTVALNTIRSRSAEKNPPKQIKSEAVSEALRGRRGKKAR